MCQCGCAYEDYYGDCKKPRGVPCPDDEAENEAYDAHWDSVYEYRRDAAILDGRDD